MQTIFISIKKIKKKEKILKKVEKCYSKLQTNFKNIEGISYLEFSQ